MEKLDSIFLKTGDVIHYHGVPMFLTTDIMVLDMLDAKREQIKVMRLVNGVDDENHE